MAELRAPEFSQSAEVLDEAFLSLYASVSRRNRSTLWEVLPISENPLFASGDDEDEIPRRSLEMTLKQTWIPFWDSPMMFSVEASYRNRGLLATMGVKNVHQNSKILEESKIVIAKHPTVEKLDLCRKTGPATDACYVFLQVSLLNCQFQMHNFAEEKGLAMVVTMESYLSVLEIIELYWERIEAKVKAQMDEIDRGSLVAEVFPNFLSSGHGIFVISSIVVEDFANFQLLLDISANSRSPRGQEITLSLRYTDAGCGAKFQIPLRALKVHSKNHKFLVNVSKRNKKLTAPGGGTSQNHSVQRPATPDEPSGMCDEEQRQQQQDVPSFMRPNIDPEFPILDETLVLSLFAGGVDEVAGELAASCSTVESEKSKLSSTSSKRFDVRPPTDSHAVPEKSKLASKFSAKAVNLRRQNDGGPSQEIFSPSPAKIRNLESSHSSTSGRRNGGGKKKTDDVAAVKNWQEFKKQNPALAKDRKGGLFRN
jgi:hypothetical protein